jgi:hypothetical protein
MTQAYAQQPAGRSFAIGDYYLIVLALLLGGYAVLGKSFAYIGAGPLYVGEMVFALGAIAFLHSRCIIATLSMLPSLLLAIMAGWVGLRTFPYVSEYGFDALRDSVIVGYGGFAFIVAALLLERPHRLLLLVPFLRVLGSAIILVSPILLVLSASYSEAPLLDGIKSGTLAVHLGGAAVMMLLGFRRVNLGWLIILFIGVLLVSMHSRGGMLAFIIPLIVAVIAVGKWRKLAPAFGLVVALVGLLHILSLSIPTDLSLSIPTMPTDDTRHTDEETRNLSIGQLVENAKSIFGPSDSGGDLEDTKSWRLAWWDTILNYTFDGPYFWTGKGFGLNLATADGFVVGEMEHPEAPLLRSPHNAHFTILARSGVPGLMLWFLTLGSWSIMLLSNIVRARARGDNVWANFFILIFCYALGFIIDGTFDVALEGPMSGIWFWCLFGVGVGATMIWRADAAPEGHSMSSSGASGES